MSGKSPVELEVPKGLRALPQASLDKLSKRFFAKVGKEITCAEFIIVARCSESDALSLFRLLENGGFARIWADAYEVEHETYWLRFPFFQGPPPLPATIELEDETTVEITDPNQLAYEIMAEVKRPVHLVGGRTDALFAIGGGREPPGQAQPQALDAAPAAVGGCAVCCCAAVSNGEAVNYHYPELLWSTVDLGSAGQHHAFALPDVPFDVSRSNVRDYADGYVRAMFSMDIHGVAYHFDTTKRLCQEGREDGSALTVAKTTVLELETSTNSFLLAHCGDDLQAVLTGFSGKRLITSGRITPISLGGGERFRVRAITQVEGWGVSLRIALGVALTPGTYPC